MKKLILIILGIISVQVYAQKYKDYQSAEFVVGKDTLPYRIFYPDDMQVARKYPLILHLHGAGSRGTENWRQLIHGSKFLHNKEIRKQYPAVVIFPQCPKDFMWNNREKEKVMGKWIFEFPLKENPPKYARLANLLVEEFMKKYFIDTCKMYIMGLSMGGIGTLEFLYRWPDKYAAAVVVCGGNNPQLTNTYCHIPIWFFHGDADRTVPAKYSKAVFEELKKCSKNTKYTIYPNVGHNSWDSAYSNPDLLKWLMKFEK